MVSSTTVLGLTTIVGSDGVDLVTHMSTGISQRVEDLLTGAAYPAGNLTLDFNSGSNRTLTIKNAGAGTGGLVVEDAITLTNGPLTVSAGGLTVTTGGTTLTNTGAAAVTLNRTEGAGQEHHLSFQRNAVAKFHIGLDASDLLTVWDSAFAATPLKLTSAGVLTLVSKVYPGTDGGAAQSASGLYAGTGAPNNANGSNGDIYFRSDGGAGTTIYQRRAGAWTGIV